MYWGLADLGFVLFVLPAALFSFWAQARVVRAFRRYSRVPARAGLTGAEVAKELLSLAGVRGVRVSAVPGELSDHYNPRARELRFSEAVYGGCSVAALGVAAHEAGHAIQHAVGYGPLALRSALAPAVGFGSRLAVPVVFAGLVLGWEPLLDLGVLLVGAVVVFAAVTLPVEYDASRRALAELEAGGFAAGGELAAVREVLGAAALTYVAALAAAVAQLLRLLLLREARRR